MTLSPNILVPICAYYILVPHIEIWYNHNEEGESMAKTKTSSAVKERYNSKAYDDVRLRMVKGRKEIVQADADRAGESLNEYINKAILFRMGLDRWPDIEERP